MQVQKEPPVNIVEMVTKKCEEMKREMLVEVETIRDQTRGELEGAAIQMRTLQEAMANQQAKMSKVEEVITTTAASAAADQRKTQDMVEIMMRMMKETGKPDTDVELEDPCDKLAASGARWGANTMQELVQATEYCLVYRQAESARERSNTRMLVRSG